MKKKKRPAARAGAGRSGLANQVRIIGGYWRGRRLRLAAGAAIRPTPDRVRQTLFDWLQPRISDARCLDLFAGSGALGIEALSRGAGEVVFVDRDARVVRQVRAALEDLGVTAPQVYTADAFAFLRRDVQPFDVVFLDPPFASGLLAPVCGLLEKRGWLKDPALIYLEAPRRDGPPPLPAGWEILKSKQAGEVGYYLVERRTERPAADGGKTP
jgi:16S rRNA (guanine966-N2)-methyltransferase